MQHTKENVRTLLPVLLNFLIFSLILIRPCWGPPPGPGDPSVPLWSDFTRWLVVGSVIVYGVFRAGRK